MKGFKSLLQFLPEILMVGVVLFYWNNTYLGNPVAWVLMALVVLQLITQMTIPGLAISGLFVFLSMWIILAFISDLVKFPVEAKDPTRFVLIGISICVPQTACSVFMLIKYARRLEPDGRNSPA